MHMEFAAPIGISDFRKLRAQGRSYVDKTECIARMLAAPAEVLLFPRPRRFGKTLLLTTLQAFVERGSDDRSALFAGLAIWDREDARQHLARYPVISMTFKDVKYETWPKCLAALSRSLARIVQSQGALRPALTGMEARTFDALLDESDDEGLLADSLVLLSGILHRHHGEPVFLLIDEYDTPIHAGYTHGYYDDAVRFFRNFLSGGLKDNSHLFKGILTGILRVAKESIFSGLNNLDVFSILRPEHADAFGFTETEVADLAHAAAAVEHLPTLREWYDGYRFGGQTIYNPWSVLKFLASADKQPQAHWVATGSEDILRDLITAGRLGSLSDQEALLRGECVERPIVDPISLRDLDQRPDAVWSMLLFSGYLTAEDIRYGGPRVEASLRIPNREVHGLYQTTVLEWLESGLETASAVDTLLGDLLAGRAERVEAALERLLIDHVSYHDLPRTARELPYHMFVLGLLVRLAPEYDVRSNRESGLGRADVLDMLFGPRAPGKPGVVIELKSFDPRRDGSPEQALAAALDQIARSDYAAELRAHGADPVHVYAAVFDQKRAYVRTAAQAQSA
jgi:Predicted AAA-ATPase/PD-(D/E)XK nuclease superfamily